MRYLFPFLLLVGCSSFPMKYQVYELKPGHQDVIWVYLKGKLHRCWQNGNAPVCQEAAVLPPHDPPAGAEPPRTPKPSNIPTDPAPPDTEWPNKPAAP